MLRLGTALGTLTAILIAAPAFAQTYSPISLEDLRSQGDRFRGKRVEIQGFVSPLGRRLQFVGQVGDSQPRLVDIAKIPPDQAAQITERCLAGCRGVVRGTVDMVGMQLGIVADTVTPPGR